MQAYSRYNDVDNLGCARLGYSGIRIYSGIHSAIYSRILYSSYFAPGSRIAGREIQDCGIRIAPKQTLTHIIPILLIPNRSQTNAPLIICRDCKSKDI